MEQHLDNITIELLAKVKKQNHLQRYGILGIIHWWRVYENNLLLTRQNGVNKKVVQFFFNLMIVPKEMKTGRKIMV